MTSCTCIQMATSPKDAIDNAKLCKVTRFAGKQLRYLSHLVKLSECYEIPNAFSSLASRRNDEASSEHNERVAATDLFPLANQCPRLAIRPHTDQSGTERIDSFFLFFLALFGSHDKAERAPS